MGRLEGDDDASIHTHSMPQIMVLLGMPCLTLLCSPLNFVSKGIGNVFPAFMHWAPMGFHCAQEVMHSLVGVLLSRNIRAQQIAAAAIADICAAAPRMEDAFLSVRPLTLQLTSLLYCVIKTRFWSGQSFSTQGTQVVSLRYQGLKEAW